MRILVIEDSEKHLADARKYVKKLVGCTVDFATTLAEALELLQKNKYDGVISDVFFPAKVGASAETFENAITISAKLLEMGIFHVFNTAGDHHGLEYQGFLWKTPKAILADDGGDLPNFLMTGMVIENYANDASKKQWQAAFRFVLLVCALLKFPDKGVKIATKCEDDIGYFPYGDYGQLTKSFKSCRHPFVVELFKKFNA
jgi:CheY-like chemotaxis protein